MQAVAELVELFNAARPVREYRCARVLKVRTPRAACLLGSRAQLCAAPGTQIHNAAQHRASEAARQHGAQLLLFAAPPDELAHVAAQGFSAGPAAGTSEWAHLGPRLGDDIAVADRCWQTHVGAALAAAPGEQDVAWRCALVLAPLPREALHVPLSATQLQAASGSALAQLQHLLHRTACSCAVLSPGEAEGGTRVWSVHALQELVPCYLVEYAARL